MQEEERQKQIEDDKILRQQKIQESIK